MSTGRKAEESTPPVANCNKHTSRLSAAMPLLLHNCAPRTSRQTLKELIQVIVLHDQSLVAGFTGGHRDTADGAALRVIANI